jgi:tryptophan synthase alpha chain
MPEGARRLGRAFASSPHATGLIPFLTAGYPSLDVSLELIRGLEQAGGRAVEIGIPFSDPIADGPEIQRASEWALREGTGPSEVLGLIRRYREGGGTLPLVIMSYANPVLRAGGTAFARQAREAGADAVLLTDLPPEELPEMWQALDAAGLDTIMLVAPTTAPERLPLLLRRCRGFVYCVARTGVTGASEGYAGSLHERLAELRRSTDLPIALGFGVATAEQARGLRGQVDAVVVGAAFMREIARDPGSGATGRVVSLARELAAALR